MSRSRTKKHRNRTGSLALLIGLAALLIPLTVIVSVQAYAVPTMARETESWFTYRQELGFSYSANVSPGKTYPKPVVAPDDLARLKLHSQASAYRRVLFGRLAESVDVLIPYSFESDRPGEITGRLEVAGTLVAPNLWQRPYTLAAPIQLQAAGQAVSDQVRLNVPLKPIWDEMEEIRKETGVLIDTMELVITPVVQLSVNGQKNPVALSMNAERRIVFRSSGSVEIDEPTAVKEEKTLQFHKTVPVTSQIFGREFPVATLRQAALGLLGLLALVLISWAIPLLKGQQKASQLEDLGPGLITVNDFRVPQESSVVPLANVRELIHLHLTRERPVFQTPTGYYLLDDKACFHLSTTPS